MLREYKGRRGALELEQLLLVLLYLLLDVLLVVLDVDQLVSHLTHYLSMLSVVSGCARDAGVLLYEKLLTLSHRILLSEEVMFVSW